MKNNSDDIIDSEKPEQLIEQKPEFSWKRIAKIVLVIVVIGAALGGVYFLANVRQVKVAWAAMVFDRHENYFNCYQLPFLPEVQKAIVQHGDIIDKMKVLGASSVTAEEIKCPSVDGSMYFIKGDMVVEYANRSQRQDIEKLIGDNFFGIAYRGFETK